jgi:hypothetical protein
VASGIMRTILAFSMKRETPWIWVLLSGVITLLLGLLILAHWPVSSLYILGLFPGHRSHHGRRSLDRTRVRPAPPSLRCSRQSACHAVS